MFRIFTAANSIIIRNLFSFDSTSFISCFIKEIRIQIFFKPDFNSCFDISTFFAKRVNFFFRNNLVWILCFVKLYNILRKNDLTTYVLTSFFSLSLLQKLENHVRIWNQGSTARKTGPYFEFELHTCSYF